MKLRQHIIFGTFIIATLLYLPSTVIKASDSSSAMDNLNQNHTLSLLENMSATNSERKSTQALNSCVENYYQDCYHDVITVVKLWAMQYKSLNRLDDSQPNPIWNGFLAAWEKHKQTYFPDIKPQP